VPDSRINLLAEHARSQRDLFTRAQALKCGFPKQTIAGRLTAKVWEEVEPGVYRVVPAAALDRRQQLLARVLSTDGVAAAASAAALYSWMAFPRDPVVLVGRGRRAAERPGVRSTRDLPASDVTAVDGIAATTPVRTLIDVAPGLSRPRFEDVLDLALVSGVVRVKRLEARAHELWTPSRPGCAIVLKLIAARHPEITRAANLWEARVLRLVERAGLPRPRVNYRLRVGGTTRYLDFAWPEQKVAVEFDGFVPHSSRRVFDDDRVRQNALVAAGWRVFRLTKTALDHNFAAAIAPILAALRA
jgi:very-short-patch-repair endonuclease